MFLTDILLAVLIIAVGFAIFLLSNLQKGILIKLFGWFIAVIIMFTGVFYSLKISGPGIVSGLKSSITSRVHSDMNSIKNPKNSKGNPLEKLYKDSNIDNMFNEVRDATK